MPVACVIVIRTLEITERSVICEPGKLILSLIRCDVDTVEAVVELEHATTSFGGIGIALS